MKLVFGVGINDAGYTTRKLETIGYVNGKRKRKTVWACPYYATWASMLQRCYSEKELIQFPTYRKCSVCDEWLTFSNFKSWMEKQDFNGKHLDKDLLVLGNKVYSPDYCIFVSPLVNTFMLECTSARGEYPVGVSFHKNTKKFMSYCNNPFSKKFEHLGSFTDPNAAHHAWLKRKLELAQLLADEQDDPRVAEALIERYEIRLKIFEKYLTQLD